MFSAFKTFGLDQLNCFRKTQKRIFFYSFFFRKTFSTSTFFQVTFSANTSLKNWSMSEGRRTQELLICNLSFPLSFSFSLSISLFLPLSFSLSLSHTHTLSLLVWSAPFCTLFFSQVSQRKRKSEIGKERKRERKKGEREKKRERERGRERNRGLKKRSYWNKSDWKKEDEREKLGKSNTQVREEEKR